MVDDWPSLPTHDDKAVMDGAPGVSRIDTRVSRWDRRFGGVRREISVESDRAGVDGAQVIWCGVGTLGGYGLRPMKMRLRPAGFEHE